MRIGIYGGTFNPIHTAHVHLVREFIKRLSLDRVILIPTGTPPHKATHQLASGADRIEMCRLAAADIAECPVTVSDIEVLRTGKSYTADTMTELKAQYPDDELFLLMGEDMFCTVEKWYHPERIFAAAEICAAPRDKDSFQTLVTRRRSEGKVPAAALYRAEHRVFACLIDDGARKKSAWRRYKRSCARRRRGIHPKKEALHA